MATCSNTSTYTNILDLPRISNISNGDLMIVQSDDLTTTIDFEDFLIPLENTTFAGTISSHSAQIDTNTTNIASLCSEVAQLSYNVSNITTIDVNNVTPVSNNGGGSGGSTSRNSILQAMSSTTPSFPWRTLQTVKTDSQVIAAQPLNGLWTDIVSLCGNITRSTLSSYVRVQCSVSNAIYQNGYSAGFRVCRGSTPIGVPDDVGGVRLPATATRTNNINGATTGQPFALETTTFEIIDTLKNITTSNLTYKVQVRSSTGAYINVPNLVNTASYGFNAISTITLTELV
jgi:hypothetical protein